MHDTRRRGVVKGLLGLPIVAAIVDWSKPIEAHEVPITPRERRRLEGISLARMINTAQARYFGASGRYAALDDLFSHPKVETFLDSERAAKKGIGRDLLRSMDVPAGKLRSGWTFRLLVSDDGSRYSVVITDETSDGLASLSTDERGIIYHGTLRSGTPFSRWLTAGDLVAGPSIGVRPAQPPSKLRAILQSIAASIVAPVHANHCSGGSDCCCFLSCCHSEPCPCLGSCQSELPLPGEEEIECENCGCQCCVWCCSA